MPEDRSPTVSATVAEHLPHLRRYARALTGDQQRGDNFVALLLETLIEDPSTIDPAREPRVALYAAFQRLWAAADTDADAPPDHPRGGAEAVALERLGRLTPPSRQALLLTTVEGFTRGEVAKIMDVDRGEVDILVGDAMAALKDQTRARVLIIEDEPLIAMDIEAIVTEAGHSVSRIADTRARAVAAAQEESPDLVLADIQLADGSSGIDAVGEILTSIEAPVIFITAYPERLLTGARPEPTFLISKPFRAETVHAAISQALFFRTPLTPA